MLGTNRGSACPLGLTLVCVTGRQRIYELVRTHCDTRNFLYSFHKNLFVSLLQTSKRANVTTIVLQQFLFQNTENQLNALTTDMNHNKISRVGTIRVVGNNVCLYVRTV